MQAKPRSRTIRLRERCCLTLTVKTGRNLWLSESFSKSLNIFTSEISFDLYALDILLNLFSLKGEIVNSISRILTKVGYEKVRCKFFTNDFSKKIKKISDKIMCFYQNNITLRNFRNILMPFLTISK